MRMANREPLQARRLIALGLALGACMIVPWAHSAEETQRPRDAAEAVREGDVSQWLKYYERERSDAPVPTKPAQSVPAAPVQEKTASPSNDPASR